MTSTAPIHHTQAWMRDPIVILGCHKSGTSLLRSLFDGHPDLYVFPHEAHFFQLAGFGVEYPLRPASAREMSHAEMVERMVHELQRQNAGPDVHGDSGAHGGYDVQVFSEAILYSTYESPQELFELFHGALIQSLDGDWPQHGTRVVEKSVEHAEYASVLAAMYPNAQFVHVVRNPYATTVGLRQIRTREERYPYMGPAAATIAANTYYLLRNRKSISRYHVVRYEDLVLSPERVMRRLAQTLGVEFSEMLLRPTHRGRVRSGGRSAGKLLSGASPDSLDRWKGEITPFETHLVNAVAKPLFDEKFYTMEPAAAKAVMPARRERPQTYIANRLLLRYGL